MGLLLHEVKHVELMHPQRCKDAKLDKQVYNMAGDYVINLQIKDMRIPLPQGGLLDEQYRGMGTLEVYDRLIQNQQDSDPWNFGASDLIEGNSEATQDQVEELILRAAVATEKQGGAVPDHVKRRIDEILHPKVNWRVILRHRIQDKLKDDYCWSKPNRRLHASTGLWLPGLTGQKVDSVIVGVDVSGSIEARELDQYWAEIQEIQQTCNPETLRVIGFDTRITCDTTYRYGQPLVPVEMDGGGGTLIGPVLEILKASVADIAIVLTDGEFFDHIPENWNFDGDLIWIQTGDSSFTPDCGEVIPLESI
jgi:predicted metal-dependent peptidase